MMRKLPILERKLTLVIEAGDKTCAREPGKFCRFFGLMKFGSVPVCMLFPAESPERGDVGGRTFLKEKRGFVQRCPACLAAEKMGAITPYVVVAVPKQMARARR